MNYLISAKAKIGENCKFGQGVIVEEEVIIGDGVHIGERTIVYKGTKIGANSLVQPNCLLGLAGDEKGEGVLEIGANSTIRAGSIIYSNVSIGENFNSGHNILIRAGSKLGPRVLVGSYSVLDGLVLVGNDTKIQTGVYLTKGVIVGEKVFIGPYVKTTNDKYMFYGADLKPNVIEKECRLGCGTILLPGVKLGERVVTGSGTVVVKDVAMESIIVGNPARTLKKREVDKGGRSQ